MYQPVELLRSDQVAGSQGLCLPFRDANLCGKRRGASECGQNTPLATQSRDAFGWEAVYEKLKELHLGECAEHERTGRWVGRLARAVAVLAVLLITGVLVVWRQLA